jgi:hypothetical protein
VTQPGSFPDRPRGRRARHGGDVPEGQRREARGPDEREFPDLEPTRAQRPSETGIGGRGRHSAGRDGAGRDGGRREPAAPGHAARGTGGWEGGGGAPAPWGGDGAPAQGQRYGGQQPSHQDLRGIDQYGGEQISAQPQGGPGLQPPAAQAQRAPGQGTQVQGTRPWDGRDAEVSDDPMEAFSERWARRGVEGPAKRRRGLLIGAGGVAVIAIAVIAYLGFGGHTGSGSVGFGSLVTTFLPGEVQKVPDACKSVSAATVSQYLPGGQANIAAPPLNGGAESQCTWTLDSPPTYRVIEVDVSAFSPTGLASGNGSATFAAIDAYANDLQVLQKPAANSGQPPATISQLPGLGAAALAATQVYHVHGAVTDKATVIVRFHNVIVTAVVNGLQHAVTSKGTYGPVDMATLGAAARQVATETVAQLTA